LGCYTIVWLDNTLYFVFDNNANYTHQIAKIGSEYLYPSRVKIAPFYPAGKAIFTRGHYIQNPSTIQPATVLGGSFFSRSTRAMIFDVSLAMRASH
jgi:hypothetical protein